jgi:hypothetical protein
MNFKNIHSTRSTSTDRFGTLHMPSDENPRPARQDETPRFQTLPSQPVVISSPHAPALHWNVPTPGNIPPEQQLVLVDSDPHEPNDMRKAINEEWDHITFDAKLDFLCDRHKYPRYGKLIEYILQERQNPSFPGTALMALAKALYLRSRHDDLIIPSGGMTLNAASEARLERQYRCKAAAQDVFFLSLFVLEARTEDNYWALLASLVPLPARLRHYEQQLIDAFSVSASLQVHIDRNHYAKVFAALLARPIGKLSEELSCRRTVPFGQPLRQRAPTYDFAATLASHWQPPSDRGFLAFLIVSQPFDQLIAHIRDPIRMEFAHPLLTGILDAAVYCFDRAKSAAIPQEQAPFLMETAQRLAYLSLFLGIPFHEPLPDLLPKHKPAGLEHTGEWLNAVWRSEMPDGMKPFQDMVLQRYCFPLT